MSKGIKIEVKEGRWEEVDQVHGLSPGYVAIQVRTLEPSTYAVFRRLPDPKPMPIRKYGMVVIFDFCGEIIRAVFTDNGPEELVTFDGCVVGPHFSQYLEIIHEGKSIWKREE